MIDPKLVITESDWDDMNPELQAKTTYRTVISMREDVINLSKKVDRLVNINSQEKPCHKMETRIEKLEKFKLIKTRLNSRPDYAKSDKAFIIMARKKETQK